MRQKTMPETARTRKKIAALGDPRRQVREAGRGSREGDYAIIPYEVDGVRIQSDTEFPQRSSPKYIRTPDIPQMKTPPPDSLHSLLFFALP